MSNPIPKGYRNGWALLTLSLLILVASHEAHVFTVRGVVEASARFAVSMGVMP